MRREWLRGRQPFTFRGPLRDAALLDRPYRLAGVAIEHEDKALLGRLDHDIALTIAGVDARERRLRRQIGIPDVVMHGLECPYELAGLDAQRDHRIGMLVVARPLAAPKIRRRRGRRQEDQSARRVDRHRLPDIGLPGFDAVALERLEGPARLTAARIERAHHTARRVDAAVVADRGADHDDPAADRRRRGDLEFAGPFQLHANIGPDFTALAEAGTGDSRLRIERDQANIVRAHEDARSTCGIYRRLIVDPVSDAAADVAIGGTLVDRDLRIVAPFLRARAGIERDHLVERRAEDQTVLDEQRRRLEFGSPHQPGRPRREIARVEFECPNQVADIVGRDLSQWREARATGIATPALPGDAWPRRKQEERDESGQIAGAGRQGPPHLFRLLARFRRTRPAPRIVLLLGFGNALECGLVGLLVDLGLVVRLLAALVRLTPATAHLRLRGGNRQRQHGGRYDQNPHGRNPPRLGYKLAGNYGIANAAGSRASGNSGSRKSCSRNLAPGNL